LTPKIPTFPLPDSFVEDYYNSNVTLNIHPSGKTAVGMYHPPKSLNDVDMNNNELGVSVLRAAITLGKNGLYTFAGTWQYLDGSKQYGVFMMEMGETGRGNGWWSAAKSLPEVGSKAMKEIEKHPWKWESSEPMDQSEESWQIHKVIQWVYVKSTVFCSWLFLLMTLGSFLLSINFLDIGRISVNGSSIGVLLNYGFMILYTMIYSYFVFMYYYLRLDPPPLYVTGVVLYTLGYAAFAGLFGLLEHKIDFPELYEAFYYIGAVCFAVGSVALIVSTVPSSYISKEATFFYGSVLFLLGSICFVMDSFHMDLPLLVALGNAFFLPGRVFFLLGSTTEECDILCRGPECQKRGLCFCYGSGHMEADAEKEEGVQLGTMPKTTVKEVSYVD